MDSPLTLEQVQALGEGQEHDILAGGVMEQREAGRSLLQKL
jgi:hypothetical protein